MSEKESFLKGKHILAVDDEADILQTIVDILDESELDTARDYQTASAKIKNGGMIWPFWILWASMACNYWRRPWNGKFQP